MSNIREEVFGAIRRERDYQTRKWGSNPRSVQGWLLIIEAELAEAKQAWVKSEKDAEALKELLQVAASAVACIEQHGIYEEENRRA